MTDLEHYRTEVASHVSRGQLASVMNETKWRETCHGILALGPPVPRFRVQEVTTSRISEWDAEWYYHPRPYLGIEWLEIDPKCGQQDRRDEIVALLRSVGAPFTASEDALRVWGYLRPGASVQFD